MSEFLAAAAGALVGGLVAFSVGRSSIRWERRLQLHERVLPELLGVVGSDPRDLTRLWNLEDQMRQTATVAGRHERRLADNASDAIFELSEQTQKDRERDQYGDPIHVGPDHRRRLDQATSDAVFAVIGLAAYVSTRVTPHVLPVVITHGKHSPLAWLRQRRNLRRAGEPAAPGIG